MHEYQIQFEGSYLRYKPNLIWKAHIENKCKFKLFAWTLIQGKILMADNLESSNYAQWTARDWCTLMPLMPKCFNGLAIYVMWNLWKE